MCGDFPFRFSGISKTERTQTMDDWTTDGGALRISGLAAVDLLNGIANRKGPGYARAHRIGTDLQKAIEAEDVAGVKQGILHLVSFLCVPEWRKYSTSEDVSVFVKGVYNPLKEILPDFAFTIDKQLEFDNKTPETPPKKKLHIADLEARFSKDCVRVRYNLITHKIDIEGWNENGEYSNEGDPYPGILEDELKEEYTDATEKRITRYIGIIGLKREYNPVLEILQDGDPWDGMDRLPEIYRILHIKDDLPKVLIEKWMRQAISLQFNGLRCDENPSCESWGGEGVLCFTGAQRAGKTRFVTMLTAIGGDAYRNRHFFKAGARINTDDKDTKIQTTRRWVVELGELDATFRKSDIANLKAFIVDPDDEYRAPYEAQETQRFRHTAYFATVNKPDFLVDNTGNRRFWTVEIEESIDLDAMKQVNVVQLWKQILFLVKRDGLQSFRLTDDEFMRLNAVNRWHEQMMPGEHELRDIISGYNKLVQTPYHFEKDMVPQTASQIVQDYGLHISAPVLGKALSKLGCEIGDEKKNHGTKIYFFPKRRYTSTSVVVEKD